MTVSERSRSGPGCGSEHRDDASVRVADEMIAGLEQLGDERTVGLEVDPVDGRIRRKAGPVEYDELELLGE